MIGVIGQYEAVMPTEVKVPLVSFYRFVMITAIWRSSYKLLPRR
jgi:hypothetical protein